MGLKRGFESGKSSCILECYGYKHNEKELVIDEGQAEVKENLWLIFKRIQYRLNYKRVRYKNIKSSKGKDKWSKRAIQRYLQIKIYRKCNFRKTYTRVFPNNKQQINHGEQEKYLLENAHE